jgi:hypothetical protein
MLATGWYIGIYNPLQASINGIEHELNSLHAEYKKALEIKQIQTQLEDTVESLKKCAQSCKTYTNCAECIQSHMHFLLNAVQKNDLLLNAYVIDKEQDKKWYVRTKAHLEVTGSLLHIEQLLKTIKSSKTMMQCSHFTLSRLHNDQFAMGCQVSMIVLK